MYRREFNTIKSARLQRNQLNLHFLCYSYGISVPIMSLHDNQPVLTPLARQTRLSATLEINELVQKRLNQGREVVHLGFGEATFPIPPRVAAAHRDASLNTSYLPVAGLQSLREGRHCQNLTLISC